MSKKRVIITVLSLIVAVPVLFVGSIVGYLLVSGTPVIDEWECEQGEVPYVYPEGGGACAKKGSALPKGASWDPFGTGR